MKAPPYLTTRDVAALWTRERDAAERRAADAAGRAPAELPPISINTVREYVRLSTPGGPEHRFQNHPMPMPARPDSQRMVWVPAPGHTMYQLRKALRDWWRNRERNRNRPAEPPYPTGALQWFTMDDVARIWTEERRAEEGPDAPEITWNTVKSYVWFSEPAPRGKPPKRFQDHPVPPSVRVDGQRRVWIPDIGETLADVEEELRLWWRNRAARPQRKARRGRTT